MLDTKKLLYILPELAYVAEVLPDKKPHSFVVHSFTQINGEFLTEEQFNTTNIIKLFSKLEKGETYHVILPDFLFTNTIVSIKGNSDKSIKDELKNQLFPELGLEPETHLLDSSVLNEIRGTSRVQLSAIERKLLVPLRVAAQAAEVSVTAISPLSWTVKSLVSLEPSITVLQLGSHLFVCEHYIGIDQASYSPLDDETAVIDAIKTLKGSEPSIQTVYLLSNSLVEERLKEQLAKTLPIQQIAGGSDSTEKMPPYTQAIIEYGAKTLSIPDYPVPLFAATKATAEEMAEFKDELSSLTVPAKAEDEVEELPKPAAPVHTPESVKTEPVPAKPEEPKSKKEEIEELPKPTEKAASATAPAEPAAVEEETDDSSDTLEAAVAAAATAPATSEALSLGAASVSEKVVTAPTVSNVTATTEKMSSPAEAPETARITSTPSRLVKQEAPPVELRKISPETVKRETTSAPVTTSNSDLDIPLLGRAQSAVVSPTKDQVAPSRPTIKNKSGVQSMLKMILITIGVFCATVAIGIGVALAFLKFSGASNKPAETPVVEVQTTPTVAPSTPAPASASATTPTPAASSSATKAPTNAKILIVNATTKAGYAGTFKSKIESAKIGTVTAGNAKEKYTSGFIGYMKTDNPELLAAVKKATGLDITVDKKAAAEDAQNKYDLVLVLAE